MRWFWRADASSAAWATLRESGPIEKDKEVGKRRREGDERREGLDNGSLEGRVGVFSRLNVRLELDRLASEERLGDSRPHGQELGVVARHVSLQGALGESNEKEIDKGKAGDHPLGLQIAE